MAISPLGEFVPSATDAEVTRTRLSAQPRIPTVSGDQYKMLLRIARALHRRCPSWTLSPSAVVHEALLKVQAYSDLPPGDDLHFMALMARVMRHVLVDAARKRLGVKNGGRLKMVPLTEGARHTALNPVEFLDLNRALDELEKMNQRHLLAVVYTSWFGYTAEEVAAILKVSAKTVQRDLRAANAWLASRLSAAAEK